jgi:hypothetical protein
MTLKLNEDGLIINKIVSSEVEFSSVKIGNGILHEDNSGKICWNDNTIENPDLSSYVTTSALNSKGYLTSSSLSDYAKKTDLNSYATTSSLSSYIKTSALKSYVSETWKNGRSWYRKYSDGWIEQGGYINSGVAGSWKTTVSLHKAYTSASTYNVILTVDDIDPNGDRTQNCGIGTYSKTSSSFSVAQENSGSPYASWYACGY